MMASSVCISVQMAKGETQRLICCSFAVIIITCTPCRSSEGTALKGIPQWLPESTTVHSGTLMHTDDAITGIICVHQCTDGKGGNSEGSYAVVML